jgi:peptidyl-tRNA hydrolase, PTH1 family
MTDEPPIGVEEPGEETLPIRLIVGLGNPGPEYSGNRHNVGYWVINRLARQNNINIKSGKSAAIGRGTVGGRPVTLAKPRAYVNQSGDAVWKLIKEEKLDDASELLVVYDELDLPVAKLRLRGKGGHAGQRGLRSIVEAVGSDRFPRLRIGIGRPVVDGEPSYDPGDVASYVLSDPPPDERELLDEAVKCAVEGIQIALARGLEAAMQSLN